MHETKTPYKPAPKTYNFEQVFATSPIFYKNVGRKIQKRSSEMFGELTGLEPDVLRITIGRQILTWLMTSALAVSNCTSSPSYVFPYCAPVQDEAVC